MMRALYGSLYHLHGVVVAAATTTHTHLHTGVVAAGAPLVPCTHLHVPSRELRKLGVDLKLDDTARRLCRVARLYLRLAALVEVARGEGPTATADDLELRQPVGLLL